MSAAATKVGNSIRNGPLMRTDFTVAFTGTYASGGDVLDLSGLNPAGSTDGRVPVSVQVQDSGGIIVTYEPKATDALGLIHAWTNSTGGTNSILTEHSNAQVVAGLSGQVAYGVAFWSPAGISVCV